MSPSCASTARVRDFFCDLDLFVAYALLNRSHICLVPLGRTMIAIGILELDKGYGSRGTEGGVAGTELPDEAGFEHLALSARASAFRRAARESLHARQELPRAQECKSHCSHWRSLLTESPMFGPTVEVGTPWPPS